MNEVVPPSAFLPYRQFIIHDDKKRPLSPFTLAPANPHDPSNWLSFNEAAALSPLVGFVFTHSDNFFFLDIDKAYNDNIWSELATRLCQQLDGCAIEVSRSLTGLHIFGQYSSLPKHRNRGPNGLELYTSGRYVALTGIGLVGDASKVVDLSPIISEYFTPDESDDPTTTNWTTVPVPEWNGPADDNGLIDAMLKSTGGAAAMFGQKASIHDLWHRNVEVLSRIWPDPKRDYDASSADAALAQHLAFWTGNNCDQIKRLMMRSALVRDKYHRKDYMQRTILRAVTQCKEAYKGKLEFTIAATTKGWPKPSPLPADLPPVMPLNPSLIPAPLRDWLLDMANRMQIPPDFSTAAAVVALGSIIGRGCAIHPKKHDDWLVVPNLWGAVVGRPSLMKTPAVSEAQRHLNRLEKEARDDYNKKAAAFEIEKEILKLTKSTIGEEIKKALKSGAAIDEARNRLAALQDDEPTRRRFQTQDGTTEKIGELLNQNSRGLLINRDELNPWFRSLDKDGREGDRGFFLEAWNGTGSFTYDRIGRGTLDISALCASVFGALTPGPLSTYVYQASRGGNGDDGLLQRFQVIVWPDVPKGWRNVDRWPDTLAKNRAWNIYKTLSGDIPGAKQEAGDDIPSLRFSPDGQTVFDDWRNALETRMRGDHGLPPEMESHLIKYRSLMPSLALIFHLVAVADGSTPPGPVSGPAAQMAAEWCEYLESHAARVYGGAMMPGMEAAKEIVKHIRRNAIQNGCTPRDIYRNQWSKLTSPEEVKAGLRIPVESGQHSGGKKTTVPMGKRPAFRFDCGHHSDEKGQCRMRE